MRNTTRIGIMLATPFGIGISVPGLVAMVGSVLTLVGDRALRNSNLDIAQDRITEQTRLVVTNLRQVLGQSDPVLDRLSVLAKSHEPGEPIENVARPLVDLMYGRPAINFVSISFPDGTFQGASLEGDGVIRFQDSRIQSGGTHAVFYDVVGKDGLRPHREERSAYDPREREFYRLALQHSRRVWTRPYTFYGSHYTGVTRAEAIHVDGRVGRHLHAVITVDFTVNSLSDYLKVQQLPGLRALLYTAEGALLAYPQGAARIARLPLHSDHPLRYDDLQEPVLSAFFGMPESRAVSHLKLGRLQVGSEGFVTAIAPIAMDRSMSWFVAYLAPESYFLGGLHGYERRSLFIGTSAVLTAMLVGWLFARHIVRTRREIAEARHEAHDARQTAQRLGQYVLERKLGEGAMGVVYRARHALLRRPTAIKLLAKEQVDELALQRFAREVRATARLTHPNTVTIYDYGRTPEGVFYYAMELLDGINLQQVVHATGRMPAGRVRHVLVQIAEALADAHAAGLIHRDVKPANIMLCRQSTRHEVAKLLDFGLVKQLPDALAQAQRQALLESADDSVSGNRDSVRLDGVPALNGTPLYMAPEAICDPLRVGPRSDVYALGAVGYFLLVGAPVFNGTSILEIYRSHLHTKPIVPSVRLGAAVPASIEALILRCLAKDPTQRIASAEAFVHELSALSDIEPWTASDSRTWWSAHDKLAADLVEGHQSIGAVGIAGRLKPEPTATLTVDLRDR